MDLIASSTRTRAWRRAVGPISLLSILAPLWSTTTFAQDAALASVPDSPTCHQLLLQATLQAESNPQGAMRTLEQALKTPTALVPVDAEATLFRPVRAEALALLSRAPELLHAWTESIGPRADRVLEREGPLEAWRRFPATGAAVQAGLAMARDALARGAPAVASWRLDQVRHDPAFQAADEGTWLRMRAIAAWGEGDQPGAQTAADRLGALEGPEASALLRERFVGAPSVADASGSPLDRIADCDLTIVPGEPSWRVALGDTPLERARRAATDRNDPQEDVDAQREAGAFRSMLPVESDGKLLVASGGAVAAFDALTHVRRWSVGGTALAFAPTGDPAPLSMPVASHGIAFTLLGPAQAPQRPRILVAVDIDDGAIEWMAGLGQVVGDIDEEQSIPEGVGIPVACDAGVAVQTRRVDARAQATAEVHSFEAGSGNTAWTVLLGTAAQIGAATREPTQLLVHGGTYLVPSTVGTYARLEAETGDILWLRRLPCPLRGSGSRGRPFELGTGAIVNGQWMALSPDLRSIVAFDIQSGGLINEVPTGPGTAAGPVRYLISTTDAIVAVGREVHLLDTTMQRRVWSREDLVPAGRVVRARVGSVDALVVPRDGIVTIIDSATGSSIAERGAPAANVVSGGIGLAAATESELLAWVPTDNALDRLVRTLRDEPGNLAAACALLDLTVRLKDDALLRQALEFLCAAVQLLTDPTDADQISLAAAMGRASSEPAMPHALVARLFDAIDHSAFGGELVARAGLAKAEWLSRHNEAKAAVQALWSMVHDPRLEAVMIPAQVSTPVSQRGTPALTRAPVAAGALLAAITSLGQAAWPSAHDAPSSQWITRLKEEGRPATAPVSPGKPSSSPSAAVFAESLTDFVRIPCHPLAIEPAWPVEDIVLGWRPGAIEAYSLDRGELAWRVATAGTSRPTTLRLADGTLAVILADAVIALDPATGSIKAQCRDLPSALGLEDTINVTIPRRTSAVVMHSTAIADAVVIGSDQSVACLEPVGAALVPRWTWSEPGAAVVGLHHADGTVWVIAQRLGPDGGPQGLVQALDATTGASRGQLGELPWTQARSATPIDADSLALTLGTRLLCIRSWNDSLHIDWEVPGASVSKAYPSVFALGPLLVPSGVTRMVARRGFDGRPAPFGGDETGAPTDSVSWLPCPRGAVRWAASSIESFSLEGLLEGAAAIPPDRVVRAAATDGGLAVALLQDSAGPLGLQVIQQPQRLEIAIFDLASGLRWAGSPIACPELESRLPPSRVVLGRRAIAVATQSGYVLAIAGRQPSAPAAPSPAS